MWRISDLESEKSFSPFFLFLSSLSRKEFRRKFFSKSLNDRLGRVDNRASGQRIVHNTRGEEFIQQTRCKCKEKHVFAFGVYRCERTEKWFSVPTHGVTETTRRSSPRTETSRAGVVLPLGGQGSSLPIPAALPTPLISLGTH